MDRLEVKFAADQIDAKTGEFAGYGAVFGNIDSHGDVIVPGAFGENLNEWSTRGRLPSMKLMHGTMGNPFSGDDLPIGKWSVMREDARGLYVEGKLSGLDTDHGRRIYGLMKDGVLDGLSIGYRVKKFTRGTGTAAPKRQLEGVSLFEVSLVDDPSNDRARVSAVKSAGEIKTIREFEDFLRDVGRYSHSAAKAIAAGGFKAAEPRDEDDADAIAALLRRNIDILK
jgi:HK97 family phage prohead protease